MPRLIVTILGIVLSSRLVSLYAEEGPLLEKKTSSKTESKRQAFLVPAPVVLPQLEISSQGEELTTLKTEQPTPPIPLAVAVPTIEIPIEQVKQVPVSSQEKTERIVYEKVKETEEKPLFVQELQPIIVTATKTPIPADQVASSVSVITGEYLKNHQIHLVSEALRHLPGVTLQQTGGVGRQASLFVRGSNPGQLLVMIDGVKVNSSTTGDYDFASLSTESIDRIEVMKGPQSTLYGSQAMAGVVNIITKQPEKGNRFSGKVEYGTMNSWYESLSASNRFQKGDLSVSASRIESDGISQYDRFRDTNVSSRLGIKLNEDSRMDTTFRFTTALVNIADGAFLPDPNSYSKTRQHIFQTTYQSHLSDQWDQKLTGSFFHDRLFSLDISNPGSSELDYLFKLDSDNYTLEWQNNYQLNDSNLLTGGYQWTYTEANNKSFDQIIRNHGLYFQDQISLGERWFFTSGIRLDDYQTFGTSVNPHFSVVGLWNEKGSKLKGSIGTGFNAPTLNQLYFPDFGNPNLQPEKSIGYDVGIEQRFYQDQIKIGITYFHNRFRDLVENRLTSTGGFLPVNVGVAKTEGVEFTTGYDIAQNLSVYSHYNFLIAQDLTTGAPLIRRPKQSGGISFGYTPWDRLGFHLNTLFVGRRQDESFAIDRPLRETNPGYITVDLVTSYEYKKGKRIYSKIANLTNSHYDEVIGFGGAPHTTFTFGSEAEF